MKGYEVCWYPGLDHAGIATQTRVEKELKNQNNISRHDLGREQFIDKVWEWKEKYGDIILNQLKVLGVSCDWKKLLFTMDESASDSVRDVFIKLFDEGLIYKGKRIINWSPLAMTALSDEEVEFRQVNEKFYTLKYKIENTENYLLVGTVRPETIYGDVAVAVNPNDERYKNLIGKKVLVPYVNRSVPIIADEYADPEFGTGCVKITPAHDPNDFEVGLRHNLEMINTINPNGTMNEFAGELIGLDRFEARKNIVDKLANENLIDKIEDYIHNVGYSQRGGEPIEPYLSDQWFVKMKPLAEKAKECVANGEVQFHPSHWSKTYDHWMNNIKDWCISRQLWWGHRIPVYYSEDGRFTAARNEKEARAKLNISNELAMYQDEDVLDTWFSSWLWPLTTMRWDIDEPYNTNNEINKFLPTDLLITGPDIIFFWVARMIMATKHLNNRIPFKHVYFTSMIRDGHGRKLSKSLGNSPDPLNIIEKYGADSVRFTMLYLAPLGMDVRMDVDVKSQDIASMEIGRNFANKVWNAGRFLLIKKQEIFSDNDFTLSNEEMPRNLKWIYSKLNSTINNLNVSLDNFKVNEYSKSIYEFIWSDFCDWYIETLKIELSNSSDEIYRAKLLNSSIDVYLTIIKLLHPIMPFITEEIWQLIHSSNSTQSISIEKYPESNSLLITYKIESEFELIQIIVEEIRKLRLSVNIPPSQKVKLTILTTQDEILSLLKSELKLLAKMSKSEEINLNNDSKPNGTISSLVRGIEICLHIDGLIDIVSEKKRIESEIERLESQINSIKKKLDNEKFVQNALPEIVENERKKFNDWTLAVEKLKINLNILN